MHKIWIIVISFISLVITSSNVNAITKTFHVKSHKSNCVTEVARLCHIIKDPSNSIEWRFLYEWIEGFEYEWGYDYVLYLDESKIEPRPLNGHQYKYKLIEVFSKIKNAETFSISVDPSSSSKKNDNLKKKSNNVYLLYYDALIKCNSTDCKKLDLLINSNKPMKLFLSVNKKSKEPLDLLNIE